MKPDPANMTPPAIASINFVKTTPASTFAPIGEPGGEDGAHPKK